jgi:hypothetical protein
VPAVGDLTLAAGFLITAAIYLGWYALAGTGHENTLAAIAAR